MNEAKKRHKSKSTPMLRKNRRSEMPLMKVGNKWKWGTSGKLYKSKGGALRQMRAILATGWTERKNSKPK